MPSRSRSRSRTRSRSRSPLKIPMNRITRKKLSNYLNTNSLVNLARTEKKMNSTLNSYIKQKKRQNRVPRISDLSRRKQELRLRAPLLTRARANRLYNASSNGMLRSNLGNFNVLNSKRRPRL